MSRDSAPAITLRSVRAVIRNEPARNARRDSSPVPSLSTLHTRATSVSPLYSFTAPLPNFFPPRRRWRSRAIALIAETISLGRSSSVWRQVVRRDLSDNAHRDSARCHDPNRHLKGLFLLLWTLYERSDLFFITEIYSVGNVNALAMRDVFGCF